MAAEVIEVKWGTWEELLLSGAVLRHGNRDWNVVASELRYRTLHPYSFTPEVCKAKYEDLQQRYAGCKAWFDELRKKRVAELRQALELAEDSIWSLESKLELLKSDKENDDLIELPFTYKKSDGFESYSKDTSKDGLSAGSFTKEAMSNWLSENQPASTMADEIEIKSQYINHFGLEKDASTKKVLEFSGVKLCRTLKRRRGKRKRKHCSWDVKEGNVGETEYLPTCVKENSTSNSGEACGSSGADGREDLMTILDSIMDAKIASSFFHKRLPHQNRGRYKNMIKHHMDFETIRSRISICSIITAKELFRDLLLLVNNALVFYSDAMDEHKAALLLRNLVMKSLHQHYNETSWKISKVRGLGCGTSNRAKRYRNEGKFPPSVKFIAMKNA